MSEIVFCVKTGIFDMHKLGISSQILIYNIEHFKINWAVKHVVNYCIEYICLFVRDDFNMVNSQYIAMQLYMRVDTSLRYDEIWHSPSTRTTAVAAQRYSVSNKSLKCNISTRNCPIALQFNTGVKHQKVHTQNCQWLDKHPNCIRDNTFCMPQFS